MRRIGLIGAGAIAKCVIACCRQDPELDSALIGLVVRSASLAVVRQAYPDMRVTDRIEDLLELEPEAVVEAAGHEAVLQCAAPVLAAGCRFLVLSVGALVNDAFRSLVNRQALVGGGHVILPSGALAGFDGLLALREAGLRRVFYGSVKPPLAWTGTAAESRFDLAGLQAPTTIFAGSAREAALLYPKNANLAAAVAFAGIGLDETEVELVADPKASSNHARLEAEGAAGTMVLTMSGPAFADNPKSSELTAMSIVAALRDERHGIGFR